MPGLSKCARGCVEALLLEDVEAVRHGTGARLNAPADQEPSNRTRARGTRAILSRLYARAVVEPFRECLPDCCALYRAKDIERLGRCPIQMIFYGECCYCGRARSRGARPREVKREVD